MKSKISDGQDEGKVMAEEKALLDNGWKLDDEQMGVKKTYFFRNYTKPAVGDPSRTLLDDNSGPPLRYSGAK